LNAYTRTYHGNTSIENLMRNLRITKNTATPTNVFNVSFNRTRRVTPPQPTPNHNPDGLNTERRGERVFVGNNRFSSRTRRVNTSQVNSGSSSGNMSVISGNGSARSNHAQHNIATINAYLTKARQLINGNTVTNQNIRTARTYHGIASQIYFSNLIQNGNSMNKVGKKIENMRMRIERRQLNRPSTSGNSGGTRL
jgi:hypothetical protein